MTGMHHERLAEIDLATLVPEWLDWSQAGAQLGVTPAKVRTMIRDHELARFDIAVKQVESAGRTVDRAGDADRVGGHQKRQLARLDASLFSKQRQLLP